jgi:hypothetical protein
MSEKEVPVNWQTQCQVIPLIGSRVTSIIDLCIYGTYHRVRQANGDSMSPSIIDDLILIPWIIVIIPFLPHLMSPFGIEWESWWLPGDKPPDGFIGLWFLYGAFVAWHFHWDWSLLLGFLLGAAVCLYSYIHRKLD